jgi:hypothetical protein
MKIFSKKKKEPLWCFFCKTPIDEESLFTLQYRSFEGLHTLKMCSECSKVFDEMADIKDEAYASRFRSI